MSVCGRRCSRQHRPDFLPQAPMGRFLCVRNTIVSRGKAQSKTGGIGGKMRRGTALTALFLVAFAGIAQAGTVATADYGVTKDGAPVHVFTMTNNHGMRAQVLDYGGIVCDVEAPGRDGRKANVILCQKDLKGIEASGPMSALTGRYANRMLHGFSLDGKHYDLQANPAGVTLHGGQPA